LKKVGKLRFKTQKSEKAQMRRRFFISFFSFILVFGAFSMLILLKAYDFDLSRLLSEPVEETNESTTGPETPRLTGKANFLLYCVAEDSPEIRFLCVVNADLDNRVFSVCSLSPKTRATARGAAGTLAFHLEEGGPVRLAEAVEALGGIKIDKYIGSDDAGFRTAINKLDGLVIDLKEKIDYRGGEFSLMLTPGRQTLKGESLLKYMRFNGESGDAGLDRQSETVGLMLDQFINEYNAAKGDKLFSALHNEMKDTNISIMDFKGCSYIIETAAKPANRFQTTVSRYLDGFKQSP